MVLPVGFYDLAARGLSLGLSGPLLTNSLLTDSFLTVLTNSVILELSLADLKTILLFLTFLYKLYINFHMILL